jgi:electron transfer flavoprotein-quinone oxidoreductase
LRLTMNRTQYDVVIVGAGCAGLTAAIGLARAGFTVVVVETAKEDCGAGLLGGVCFTDTLLQTDILGPEGMEPLAWERRLIERGSFFTDGRRITGTIYRDADAFLSCYTFLRSRFSKHLAEKAKGYGVELLTKSTVESLIRAGRRIIGVATTRGPLYAQLTFLAEGDAGLLVSREGLDRFPEPHDQPAFLYCLQQIIDLPPGAIEERFRLGPGQGVAYDFLLRNPARMPLNARGYVCTNRQGLTLSVVLPAKNLHGWFTGKPRQLLDWFVDMPALQPWLRHGQRGAWTAALLRTGGLRDIPYLVEDGFAIGGAAAGLGLDFPSLNLIAPATAMGLLFSRAATRIRAEGHGFDREALVRYYLEPLQQTRYWGDMEFVQRWPGYLPRAHVLFESGFDFVLDSASVWSRARRWLPWKVFAFLQVLARISWRRWSELRDEIIQLSRILRLREVTPRPALARLLLDGALNAFRDLVRRPRPHLPPAGTLRLYYHSADEEGRASSVSWVFRRWFERFRPVLAAIQRVLYINEDTPLSVKLSRAIAILLRQINLFDLLALAALTSFFALTSTMLAAMRFIFRGRRWSPAEKGFVGWSELPETDPVPQVADETLLHTGHPQIHLVCHSTQPEQQTASVAGLPHVCPTQVFEITGTPPETVRASVHSERCILCQACWRINPLADWGRNGTSDPRSAEDIESSKGEDKDDLLSGEARRNEIASLLDQLEHKLREYDVALAEGPAVVDRPHNDYLEMLARYAQQLAHRVREILHSDSCHTGEARRSMLELTDALAARAEERTRRVWQGRFAWAGADGRLLLQHHLIGLRRLLTLPAASKRALARMSDSWPDLVPAVPVSRSEDASIKHLLADIAARRYLLETLDQTVFAKTESLQADLLTVLEHDLHDSLSAQMTTLRTLLDENAASGPGRNRFSFEKAYRRQGSRFCTDLEELRKLLDVPGDWAKLDQLRVLGAERKELAESERRLIALAVDWCETAPHPADDEVNARLGRQVAHILAGKLLLSRTFASLELGEDSELAILLLRVWLDYTATLLDEFTILVREHIHPASRPGDRPLVEPDSGAPLRTQAEYLAAPSTYNSGDFLLAPLDLLQPRLVPEMVGEKEIAIAGPSAATLLRFLEDIKGRQKPQSAQSGLLYLAEALAVETIGRLAVDPPLALDLECACTRMMLTQLRLFDGALRERCTILRELAAVVIPRWIRGGTGTRARHLHRDVLEIESLKADFRRRLTTVWEVFGEVLGRNADVQASCFALAEAAAWLKAADSILGRMAWLNRLCQAEDCEELPLQQDLVRRLLAHSFAEIRDRLFRFDEDIASLRRGYYAPHVYAASLLLRCTQRQSER